MVKHLLLFTMLLIGRIAFSQVLEFSNPERLPATINTSAEEGMPLLSPDGQRLFFSRALFPGNVGGEYAGLDAWFSDLGETGWKRPGNSWDVNDRANNVVVGISKDGKTIYFVSQSGWEKTHGIYFTKRMGGRWSRPELISIPGIENQDFLGFYVSPDFDVIFISMRAPDSKGDEDIYFSVKGAGGEWSKPRSVGATINTGGFEISPFLSEDKKRLYFSSNGHGGKGNADIFYSERLYDSWETWTAPVNLERVNSPKFDAYFATYGDSVAYFTSNRDGRLADIYRTRVSQTKTILSKGQRYLTSDEWNARVGQGVNRTIVFPDQTTVLNPAQHELLFYIVNKLMLQRDIHFHLVVKAENDPSLTPSRLQAVYNNLKASGIDSTRIHKEQLGAVKPSDKAAIEIVLFQ